MAILHMIESVRSPVLDAVFLLVTKLGEEIFVILLLCALFWCIDKKTAYTIGLAYFISGLLVQCLKIGFRIDRPWVLDPAFNPVAAAVEHATGYSFPSGHTQSAAVVFGTLGFALGKKWQKALCFAVVLLVGFSRMYLGVHTLLDVGVSIVLGLAIVYAAIRFLKSDDPSAKKQLITAVLPAVFAAGAAIFSISLYSGGIIEASYVSDCMKTVGAAIGFAVGMYIERRYINFSCSGGVLRQFAKVLAGVAGVLAVKEGLKLVIGTSLAADTIRYFLIGIWLTVLFPLITNKWFTKRDNQSKEEEPV